MFSDLRLRFRALFARSAMERELDAELRFHLDRETEKLMRAGMSRTAAMRQAGIALGGVERTKEDARDSRGIALIDSLSQDLRYAWRGLRSRPGFAAAVVLTLGLGIGANTTMFGIVDRLLFRAPAHLRAPDRVHRVYLAFMGRTSERHDFHFQYTRYADLARWTSSFDRTAALAYRSLPVGAGEDAREMQIATVSASLFDFFDAPPALGRYFRADEDQTPTGAAVVVLAHGFWLARYGGRTDVLGTQLYIDRTNYTVIGVAPESFIGITEEAAPAAFVPITAYASRNPLYYQNYHWSWLEMVARRKAGVTLDAAQADLSAAYLRSWEAQLLQDPIGPATKARPHAIAGPVQLARGPLASNDSKVVTWVMGVAVIVLLVACANVASLLLARAVSRRREVALRLALGVTRMRLLQQLFTESLLLAGLGGIAGVAVAQWGAGTLRALFLPADAGAVVSDWRTLSFAALVTLGVALLTGLAPVVRALRDGVTESLRAGAREGSYRRSRLLSGLLLFQGALSVVLLIGAGLFVRSLVNVRGLRLGYDIEPVAYVEGNMRGVKLTAAEQVALDNKLLAAATAIPGVRNASMTVSVPFWSNEGRELYVPGIDSVHKLGRFMLQAGSPSYFETIGTRVLRGRGILPEDREGAPPVVVVSDAMATVLWPGQDAIGKLIRIGSDTTPYSTVVGIAETMRGRQITGEMEYWYFVPIAQYGPTYPAMFVRVDGRAADFVSALRRRLQTEMPGASYLNVTAMRTFVAPRQRAWEFGATMFVAFGGLALALAAIGLYSVIAYAVAQRTHELGVRIALGAGVSDIVRMVVGQGMAFAVTGITLGSAIAFAAGRWIEPLLFSQSAHDPGVFALVAAVLLAAAVAATVRPALRAARVDPTEALRSD